jgi:beta-hydroxylase
MLTYKWYSASQATDLKIPAFEKDFRYIKTIAVSVFNTRERTSWHFGPLRLTFRVLYNLDPIDSRDVYIEVDDKVHYWKDEPLFIFDDTMFHRSINDVDRIRYCLFMDIVRPNHFQGAFEVAIQLASAIAVSFKRLFYKNWSFVR